MTASSLRRVSIKSKCKPKLAAAAAAATTTTTQKPYSYYSILEPWLPEDITPTNSAVRQQSLYSACSCAIPLHSGFCLMAMYV
jgi:hypothetical protein